jgi:5-carboxymethyl-2-hydroxymuconate isomerase
MPHTILEYSDNLLDAPDFQALWADLHPVLVATAGCRPQDIKSRAYPCASFRMGDGAPANAFVHLAIRLLEGRDSGTREKIGQAALEVLAAHFPRTLAERPFDLTVELADMRRDSYFKVAGPRG